MAPEAVERRSKLLLVDDNDAFREMLVSWLGTRYDVVEAGNAEAALAEMRRSPPDLVVLDIMMPGVSGIDMFRQMTDDPVLAALPVVFLTAHHQALMGQERDVLARCRVVLKPFRFHELEEQLQLALKERQPPAVW